MNVEFKTKDALKEHILRGLGELSGASEALGVVMKRAVEFLEGLKGEGVSGYGIDYVLRVASFQRGSFMVTVIVRTDREELLNASWLGGGGEEQE